MYSIKHVDALSADYSAKAKQAARPLALDLGFENVYDFGGSDKFNLLEQFALCWINLAMMQGLGRNIAFKR
jgi:predicted dinucleotide-binding enzyme